MKKPVGNKSMLTAQEHAFMGSTPDIIPPGGSIDWYKPQGLLTGEYSLRAINAARKEKGFMTSPIIGLALGITRSRGEMVGISLTRIPTKGIMPQDPKLIVGKWDLSEEKLVGRDITEDLVSFMEKMSTEEVIGLHLRNGAPQVEGGVRVHPERG